MTYRKQRRSKSPPKNSPKDGGPFYKSLKPLANADEIKRKAKADELNQDSKFCNIL